MLHMDQQHLHLMSSEVIHQSVNGQVCLVTKSVFEQVVRVCLLLADRNEINSDGSSVASSPCRNEVDLTTSLTLSTWDFDLTLLLFRPVCSYHKKTAPRSGYIAPVVGKLAKFQSFRGLFFDDVDCFFYCLCFDVQTWPLYYVVS